MVNHKLAGPRLVLIWGINGLEKTIKLLAGKIFLRPLTEKDAPEVLEAIELSRRHLRPWMFWETETHRVEDVLVYIRRITKEWQEGKSRDFGIFEAHNEIYLGSAGLMDISTRHGYAELGYWVRSDRHREGIALAASVALFRLGFEQMGLHKVKVRANVKNLASQELINKLGFISEGVARDDLKVNGQWGNHLLAGLLEDEYRELAQTFDAWIPRRIPL